MPGAIYATSNNLLPFRMLYKFAENTVLIAAMRYSSINLLPDEYTDTAILDDLDTVGVGMKFSAVQVNSKERGHYEVVSWFRYHHNGAFSTFAGFAAPAHILVMIGSDGKISAPRNRYTETLVNRVRGVVYAALEEKFSALDLYQPFDSMALGDCASVFYYNPEHGYACNVTPTEIVSSVDLPTRLRQHTQELRVSGPATVASGDLATYTVSIHNRVTGEAMTTPPQRFVVESSFGYLPIRKFDGVTGTVSFPWRAADLPPGTVAKLKVGWEPYPAVSSFNVTVT